jgi:hypothetical protein
LVLPMLTSIPTSMKKVSSADSYSCRLCNVLDGRMTLSAYRRIFIIIPTIFTCPLPLSLIDSSSLSI